MNKKTVSIVVVLLLILAGAGYYFLGQSKKPSTGAEQATTQNQTQTTQKKSLSDFLSMTGSQQCTFTDKTANTSGSVFVNSGKMRGDFQSTMDGKTMASHMINDGAYVYFWTNEQKEGYKMSLDAVKKEGTEDGATKDQTPPQAVNMKQQANYSCSPWAADSSKFALPQAINFNDFSSMMQGAMHGASAKPNMPMMEGNQAACAQCDKLPASAQAQCRTALKCQ